MFSPSKFADPSQASKSNKYSKNHPYSIVRMVFLLTL
jgi:hypothetical protein